MNTTTTITAIVVHPPELSPVFGAGIITVRVDDEGGGPYVVLSQEIDGVASEIRIDFDDIEPLVQAMAQLRAQPAVQQALKVQL